ncbi:MAG: AraC family transcriptional regulator [Phycisphaerae bacterium]|nr:AraC family transcriptional regulator [Phycisphaerae bacterium]
MVKNICEKYIIGPECIERLLPLIEAGPLSNLGVTGAGVSDLRGEYRINRPHSRISGVIGTLKGHGRLKSEEGTRILSPGDLMIFPMSKPHCYEIINGKFWKIVWFTIHRPIPFESIRIVPSDQLTTLAAEYTAIIEEAATGGYLSQEVRLAKENYLACLLRRILHTECIPGKDRHYQQQLRQLWSDVMKDLSHKWTLDELAERAGFSTVHLNRICRRYYQCPVMRYITRLRMTYAAQLLAQGNFIKVETIAHRCGYDNPFAFSVAFKRHFGQSPRLSQIEG